MLARLVFLSDAFLCHPFFHSVEANENIEGKIRYSILKIIVLGIILLLLLLLSHFSCIRLCATP